MNTSELIEIIDRLVKEFDPIKIILFGSNAWGKPEKDSDIDIMVIVANDNQKPTQRASRAYRCLKGLLLPVEIFVNTQSELNKYSATPSSLSHKIIQHGKILYG